MDIITGGNQVADHTEEGTVMIERAELTELKRSNLEPYLILDVRYGKTRTQFEFIVSFTSLMNQNYRRNLIVDNLGILTEKYQNWLLAKFKKNLKDLSIVKKMKMGSIHRLQLLKEYCESKNICFDTLYLRSSLPPTQVFVNSAARLKSAHSDEESIRNNQFNTGTDKLDFIKPSCSSLIDRLPNEESKLKLSKKARLKAVFDELTRLQDKYKKLSSIDKNLFIKDLDNMSSYMYDV